VESRSAEHNLLLKLLESANIKLASMASDAFGVRSIVQQPCSALIHTL
jgi:hypothetical protein